MGLTLPGSNECVARVITSYDECNDSSGLSARGFPATAELFRSDLRPARGVTGEAGGRIVAEGTPAEVARAGTPTAPILREILGDEPRQRAG